MTTVGLLVLGLAVGLLSGMLGIGGGIVLIPALVLLFGFTQAEAQGTSLAVLSLPVAVFAALVYYDNGFVRPKVVAFIVVGFAFGAYLGARLVPHVPPGALRVGFGALLLYAGLLQVFDIRPTRMASALPAGLVAVLTAVLGRLFRRRLARRRPPEPPPAVEYHI
ncbi:MAG: permease [Isosphaera sp.]|nr:permease [Isosphaera sp.]